MFSQVDVCSLTSIKVRGNKGCSACAIQLIAASRYRQEDFFLYNVQVGHGCCLSQTYSNSGDKVSIQLTKKVKLQ